MNEFSTYEYVVAQKNKGIGKLKPILLIVFYILLAIAFLLFAVITKIGAPLISLAPIGVAVAWYITWKYTKIEHEISVTSGVVTLSEIYGSRTRKTMVEFALKSCTAIAPLTDPTKRAFADRYDAQLVYCALSAPDSENAYFATFENEKGKRCLVMFDANERMLKICKFYNPSATTIIKK